MCGTLKFNDIAKLRGEVIPVYNPNAKRYGMAVWDGFAHSDRQDWWIERGQAVAVQVKVDAFVEGTMTFQVPKGQMIQALGLRKEVIVSGRAAGRAKQVKILTRGPLNGFEAGIHKRWPLVLVNGNAYQFTPKDVIQGSVQKELF